MELRVVHFAVEAALGHQLPVGAGFHHVAAAHHQDEVGVFDGGQAVRHHKAGFIAHQAAHGLLNLHLGAGIDVAGGLVQDQHVRVDQHGAGDGHQLLLPLGDVGAVVGDHRVVALRQAHDVVVNLGRLGRLDDLLAGGVGAGVGDIFVNGAREQPGILQHHGVRAAQALAGDVADIVIIHGDLAVVDIIEAHQQVDQRGFARARGAHDGNQVAAAGVQVQVLKDQPPRLVAKAHVLHFHIAAHIGKRYRVRRVRAFQRRVQQGEHAIRRGQGGLQFAEDVGDFIDGPGELAAIHNKGRNTADGHARDGKTADLHAAGHVQKPAEHADERQGQVVDKADRGARDAGIILAFIVGLHHLAVERVQLAGDAALLMVGLERLHARYFFLDKVVQLAHLARAQAEQRVGAGGDKAGDENAERNGDDKHQHQHGGQAQHHHKRAEDGDKAGQDADHIRGQGGVDGVDIIENAADDIAHRMGIKEAHRHIGNVVKQVAAHAQRDPAADIHHRDRQEIAHDGRNQVEQHHQQRVVENAGKIHPAGLRADAVDGLARQRGPQQGEGVAADGKPQRQQQKPLHLPQIFAQAQKNSAPRPFQLFFHLGIGAAVLAAAAHAAAHHCASPPICSAAIS